MAFIDYLNSVIRVSEQLKERLDDLIAIEDVKKGHSLLRTSERCSDLYYIEKGLLRGYYYSDSKEITHWFAREGEFATCFYSFITQKPAVENIETLEPCELVSIPYSGLQKLYRDFPETERIGRLLTEAYYVKLENRLLGQHFTDAKTRYDSLLANNPTLLQRAPLGYVASYLGITQETLSRIRSQK